MSSEPTADTVRALSDPRRRLLLDALRRRDGQTVSELGESLPALGRHAVLKHLHVLEEAELVRTRKVGRHRFVHLNAVPLVQLAERWLDDYGVHVGVGLTRLQRHLEAPSPSPAPPHPQEIPVSRPESTETRTVVASIVIAATPEAIWAAMTDPDQTEQWYFGTRVVSTWEPGTPVEYVDADGDRQIVGEIVEAVAPRRLVHTFRAVWSPDVADDAASRYEITLEPMGEALTRVDVEHSGIPRGTATDAQVEGGAVVVLSALKTLLETGRPLPIG